MVAIHDHAARFFVRHNKTVLVTWFIVLLVSIYNGPALFKCFEIAYHHNDDTESGRAARMLEKGLPDYQDRMEDVVVVWCDDCKSVVGKESRRIMNKLAGWIEGVGQRFPALIKNYESYFDLEELPNNPYLSNDKKTMLFHWSFTAGPQIREGFDLFNAEVEALNQESPLHIVSAGPYANFRGAERTMFGYIVKDEMLVVPFIAAILWFMLGSVRRSVVPFICAILSISATWTTLLFVKKVVWPDFNMVITLPFITAAFSVALCVDYGLFLWGRFGEERSRGMILEEAISIMLGYSGHVVLISGAVMMMAYFSVIWYPHSNSIEIFSLGLGNMLAAFFSIITSLTITPCSIAAFPHWLDSDTSEHERLYRRMKPGKYWKKWAVMITRPPWIVLVPLCTYLAIAPVSLQLTNFHESFNTWSLLMAHTTPEFHAHKRIDSVFPRGSTMPMMVALQLTDRTHPSQSPHLQTKLNSQVLLRQTGGDSEAPIGADMFMEGVKKLVPWAGANAALKPANFFQPKMWQDMADAIQNSDLGSGEEGGDDVLNNVMDLATGGLLGKNRKRNGIASLLETGMAEKKSPLRTAEFYMYSCALVKSIIAETKGKEYQIDPDDVLSLFYLPPSRGGGPDGKCVSWQMAQFLLMQNNRAMEILGVPNKVNIGKQYQRAFSKLASDDGQVSLLVVRPKFDPMGPAGTQAAQAIRSKVLPKFRGLLQVADGEYAADTNFFSILSLMMDVQAQLYGAAPRILGLTILAMFIAIALMFRSALVPVKLVLTVVVPLTFVYGAAVAVFQNGVLNWTGLEQLSEMGGVSWEMPLFTFCVLMGLALDYDIFLFARVVEYRSKGYDNRSAVVKGMCQTGPVISAAGMIMALAFAGNMLGPFGYDNQIGFIMCVGVLVDTFIIRMCLVPCFLCMLEGLNYWPVKMPAPTKMDKCLLADAKDADFEADDED